MREEQLKGFTIINTFKGFRDKKDVTKEERGVAVSGSQNCIIVDGEKIGVRPGFEYLGGRSTDRYGIKGGGSWKPSSGSQIMWRSYDNGSNGVIEVLVGTTWEELNSSMDNGKFRSDTYWDTTEDIDWLVLVEGTADIMAWSGAMATFASATNDTGIIETINTTPTAGGTGYTYGDVLTITTGGTGGTCIVDKVDGSGVVQEVIEQEVGKDYTTGTGKATTGGTGANCTINITSISSNTLTLEGDNLWSEKRWILSGTRGGRIKDDAGTWHEFTYTCGENSKTVGVSIDISALTITAGNNILQSIRTTASKPSATAVNDFVGVYKQHLFCFNEESRIVLASVLNDYTDFSPESSPRLPGESISLTLDEVPTGWAVAPTGSSLYMQTRNYYYQFTFVDSADLTKQGYEILPTYMPDGGASNNLAISNIKNYITMITGEPTFDTLGNVLNTEGIRSTSLSDDIKNYMDSAEVDEASSSYYKNNSYLSIKSSDAFGSNNNILVRNLQQNFWETPWTLPSLLTFEHNGSLYAHDPSLKNTYKLLQGYSDGKDGTIEGAPISAKWFSNWDDFGMPFNHKEFDVMWVDGYITPSTELDFYLTYDFGAYTQKFTLIGTKEDVVLATSGGGLGFYSLGSRSLGGRGETLEETGLRRFRGFVTIPVRAFYELQTSIQSNQVNGRWEMCSYAFNVRKSNSQSNNLNFN